METNNNIPTLFVKYLQGILTDIEQQELDQWVAASKENHLLFKRFIKPLSPAEEALLDEGDERVEWEEIVRSLHPAPVRKMIWHWWKVAGILLLFIGTGAFFWIYSKSHKPPMTTKQSPSIQPVVKIGYKAILKRGNGKEFELDKINSGIISDDENLQIVKNGANCIEYRLKKPLSNLISFKYNATNPDIIITPPEGQWKVILPDSTSIWLNTSTTLGFLPNTNYQKRTVTISGEAYFEVASLNIPGQHKKVPFTVIANDIKIEVLGTHFNTRLYPNEETKKITLIEGLVKIITSNKSIILKPGEEAQLNSKGELHVANIDVEAITGWTRGKIKFNSCTIDSIMKVVKWYYDVEFDCGHLCNDRYNTTLQLNEPVTTFIKSMDSTGEMRLDFDGKKIIVK